MTEKLIESLIQWGPGMVMAALVLYGLFRLVNTVGIKMVAASEQQAAALSAQAESMQALTKSLQDFVSRDNNEHKEILIMLKLIWQRIEKEDKSGS